MKKDQRPEISGNGQRERHPAFGCIEVSRCDGTTGHMFGSKLPEHFGYIEFRLREAELFADSGRQGHFGKEIIAIYKMTYAQFVDMIGSMNRASGSPVTLSAIRKDGELVSLPNIVYDTDDVKTGAQRAIREVDLQSEEMKKKIRDARQDMEKTLDGMKISKKAREEILEVFYNLTLVFIDLPFYIQQVREATDAVVHEAHVETEAAMTSIVHGLGVRQLQKMIADDSEKENNALEEK